MMVCGVPQKLVQQAYVAIIHNHNNVTYVCLQNVYGVSCTQR